MEEKNRLMKVSDYKHIRNINEARRHYDMKLLEPKVRECLRCGIAFTSYQYSNRMCANCRTYSIGE